MTLVSQSAPDFISSAVLGNGEIINNFRLKNFIHGKKSVIFFWPMDFTFVCPSELIAINKRYSEFKNRNVEIVGISIDSVFVHKAWRNTPISNGGIGQVQYTMVSDLKREIINLYKVAHPELGVALRGSFILDKNMIVRHQSINDLPIGRNIEEIIRIIDAICFHEKHGTVCPAQWEKGKVGIDPTEIGISKYLEKNFEDL